MRAPKTLTLLLLSLCLFVGTGLLMRGVVVLRPVRTQTGEVMHRPDGRPLMEREIRSDSSAPIGTPTPACWVVSRCSVGQWREDAVIGMFDIGHMTHTPLNRAASNRAIALRLQSARPAGQVAELGSFPRAPYERTIYNRFTNS